MPTTTDPSYEVRRSRIQGRGVFATRRIRKGTRLLQYTGERISHEEADRRYDDRDGRHHTFLFVLDEDVVLDARDNENPAKYINHSCAPNCETIIDGDEIWIETLRTIEAGEELLYDYRFEWDDAYEPADVRYYGCKCGAPNCRGTILRVPRYLKGTVAKWLAGEDVPKPAKSLSLQAKEAAQAAKAAQREAKAAEREAKAAATRAKAAAKAAEASAKRAKALAREAKREMKAKRGSRGKSGPGAGSRAPAASRRGQKPLVSA